MAPGLHPQVLHGANRPQRTLLCGQSMEAGEWSLRPSSARTAGQCQCEHDEESGTQKPRYDAHSHIPETTKLTDCVKLPLETPASSSSTTYSSRRLADMLSSSPSPRVCSKSPSLRCVIASLILYRDETGNSYAMVVGDLRSDQFEVRPTNFDGQLAPKTTPAWLQYMKEHGSKHKFPKQQNRNPGKRSASDEFKVDEKRQKLTPTRGEDVTKKIKKRSRKSTKSTKTSTGKAKGTGRRASAQQVNIAADYHRSAQDGRSVGSYFARRDTLADHTAAQESMAVLQNNHYLPPAYSNWHPHTQQGFQPTTPYPMMMPATTMPPGMDQYGNLTQPVQDFTFERPYTNNQMGAGFQAVGPPFEFNAMNQHMEPYTSGGAVPSLNALPPDMDLTNADLVPAMDLRLTNSQSGTDSEDASYQTSQFEEDVGYQQQNGSFPPPGPYNQFDWRYHSRFPGNDPQ